MANNVSAAASDLASAVCEKNGCYLYDLEYLKEGKNQILRIFADKEGGITIDECETISRTISKELDRLNLIDMAYRLEVSSPGADRKLTKDWHFSKVIGKQIEISLYAPIDGKKTYLGVLDHVEEDTLHLICDGIPLPFSFDQIASSKLHFDINDILKDR